MAILFGLGILFLLLGYVMWKHPYKWETWGSEFFTKEYEPKAGVVDLRKGMGMLIFYAGGVLILFGMFRLML